MSEDFDFLYDDLEVKESESEQTLRVENEELLSENESLKERLSILLERHNKRLEENQILSRNLSSLIKTARLEVNRKNATITELKKKLDDLVFKRSDGSSCPAVVIDPKDLAPKLSIPPKVRPYQAGDLECCPPVSDLFLDASKGAHRITCGNSSVSFIRHESAFPEAPRDIVYLRLDDGTFLGKKALPSRNGQRLIMSPEDYKELKRKRTSHHERTAKRTKEERDPPYRSETKRQSHQQSDKHALEHSDRRERHEGKESSRSSRYDPSRRRRPDEDREQRSLHASGRVKESFSNRDKKFAQSSESAESQEGSKESDGSSKRSTRSTRLSEKNESKSNESSSKRVKAKSSERDQNDYKSKIISSDRCKTPTNSSKKDRDDFKSKISSSDRCKTPTNSSEKERDDRRSKMPSSDRGQPPIKSSERDRNDEKHKVTSIRDVTSTNSFEKDRCDGKNKMPSYNNDRHSTSSSERDRSYYKDKVISSKPNKPHKNSSERDRDRMSSSKWENTPTNLSKTDRDDYKNKVSSSNTDKPPEKDHKNKISSSLNRDKNSSERDRDTIKVSKRDIFDKMKDESKPNESSSNREKPSMNISKKDDRDKSEDKAPSDKRDKIPTHISVNMKDESKESYSKRDVCEKDPYYLKDRVSSPRRDKKNIHLSEKDKDDKHLKVSSSNSNKKSLDIFDNIKGDSKESSFDRNKRPLHSTEDIKDREGFKHKESSLKPDKQSSEMNVKDNAIPKYENVSSKTISIPESSTHMRKNLPAHDMREPSLHCKDDIPNTASKQTSSTAASLKVDKKSSKERESKCSNVEVKSCKSGSDEEERPHEESSTPFEKHPSIFAAGSGFKSPEKDSDSFIQIDSTFLDKKEASKKGISSWSLKVIDLPDPPKSRVACESKFVKTNSMEPSSDCHKNESLDKGKKCSPSYEKALRMSDLTKLQSELFHTEEMSSRLCGTRQKHCDEKLSRREDPTVYSERKNKTSLKEKQSHGLNFNQKNPYIPKPSPPQESLKETSIEEPSINDKPSQEDSLRSSALMQSPDRSQPPSLIANESSQPHGKLNSVTQGTSTKHPSAKRALSTPDKSPMTSPSSNYLYSTKRRRRESSKMASKDVHTEHTNEDQEKDEANTAQSIENESTLFNKIQTSSSLLIDHNLLKQSLDSQSINTLKPIHEVPYESPQRLQQTVNKGLTSSPHTESDSNPWDTKEDQNPSSFLNSSSEVAESNLYSPSRIHGPSSKEDIPGASKSILPQLSSLQGNFPKKTGSEENNKENVPNAARDEATLRENLLADLELSDSDDDSTLGAIFMSEDKSSRPLNQTPPNKETSQKKSPQNPQSALDRRRKLNAILFDDDEESEESSSSSSPKSCKESSPKMSPSLLLSPEANSFSTTIEMHSSSLQGEGLFQNIFETPGGTAKGGEEEFLASLRRINTEELENMITSREGLMNQLLEENKLCKEKLSQVYMISPVKYFREGNEVEEESKEPGELSDSECEEEEKEELEKTKENKVEALPSYSTPMSKVTTTPKSSDVNFNSTAGIACILRDDLVRTAHVSPSSGIISTPPSGALYSARKRKQISSESTPVRRSPRKHPRSFLPASGSKKSTSESSGKKSSAFARTSRFLFGDSDENQGSKTSKETRSRSCKNRK